MSDLRERVAVCIMDLTIENKTPGQIADAAIRALKGKP